MNRKLRYRVTGLDQDGDRHIFETDDKARAEAVLATWREDLQDVASSLTDSGEGAVGFRGQ